MGLNARIQQAVRDVQDKFPFYRWRLHARRNLDENFLIIVCESLKDRCRSCIIHTSLAYVMQNAHLAKELVDHRRSQDTREMPCS